MADFLVPTCQGYLLKVQVVPGARETRIVGCQGDRLRIRVAAPADKGQANEALLRFLARCLRLPRASFRLLSGHSSRAKVVAIDGFQPQVREALLKLACPPAAGAGPDKPFA